MSVFLRSTGVAVVLTILVGSAWITPYKAQGQDSRPNILLIISDDQRYDTMDFMPQTKARIFGEGVSFSSAYVTTPRCCPSRASILTGMYAHNHGVKYNNAGLPHTTPTFIQQLQANGYYTGLVGKYLNSWNRDIAPGFDYWVSRERSKDFFYEDPSLNVNGVVSWHSGYTPYIYRDYARQFLQMAVQQDKPFALIFAPPTPHGPATPAPGDEDLYPNIPPHRPPNFNEIDISDKPSWLQSLTPLSETKVQSLDEFRRNQLQSLMALDRSVATVLNILATQNKLDETMVIYLSDNGYLWGEHRMDGKIVFYEEASRVPFAIRYPPLAPIARVEQRLVANIDIAPTIYELAGLPIPRKVDGRSLVPLLNNSTDTWRTDLLIEGWSDEGTYMTQSDYMAVHTGHYVYAETVGDRAELYDLANDVYQLQNQIDNPEYALVKADLITRLSRYSGRIYKLRSFLPLLYASSELE